MSWATRPTEAWPKLQSAGPTLSIVEGVLARAKDSAPGPDGLRYCAWRAAGSETASVLHGLLWEFLAGEPVPEDFAGALVVPPEGEARG